MRVLSSTQRLLMHYWCELRHAPQLPNGKKEKTDRIGLYNLSWRLSVYNKLSVILFTIIVAISSMLAL